MGSPVAVVAPRPSSSAKAGNDAQHEAHDAAERQEHQALRLHQHEEGLARGGGHEAEFPPDHVHFSLPGARPRDKGIRAGAFDPALGFAGSDQHIARKPCIPPDRVCV